MLENESATGVDQQLSRDSTYARQCLDRSETLHSLATGRKLFELFVLVRCLCPHQSPSPHGHVDNTRSPDIHSPGIESVFGEHFGRHVRSTAMQTRGPMAGLLPSILHTFRGAKIRNLEAPVGGQQDVLGLEVTVGDARCMAMHQPAQQLLVQAIGFHLVELGRRKQERAQVPCRAELHHLAHVSAVVAEQVQCMDHVTVPQCARDTELSRRPLPVRAL